MAVALGDIFYRAATEWLRLPGNITTTRKYLSQTGTGSVSAVPAWNAVTDADLATSDVTTNNVSTAKHGFAPKAPNNTYQFLRADASYADPGIRFAEVTVSSAELLALRATPKTLVVAPGAATVLEFVSAMLLLDYNSAAYVEAGDNLAVRYTGTTGVQASDTIETTGFIDQTADTLTTARAKLDVIAAKTACENQPLVLHNIGGAEFTTGNSPMRVKINYRVWATGW